jgi:hypothetical protein
MRIGAKSRSKRLAGDVHFNTKKREARVRADEACPCSTVDSPHLEKKPRTMPGRSEIGQLAALQPQSLPTDGNAAEISALLTETFAPWHPFRRRLDLCSANIRLWSAALRLHTAGPSSELYVESAARALVGGSAAELAAIGNAERGLSGDVQIETGLDHGRIRRNR